MHTCSIKLFLPKMSILRMVLGISFLISVLMLMGCGQGLSGQAIGEDDEDIEVLKQEISDISDSIADLDTSIENLESVRDTEDVRAMEQEILGIFKRLADLNESISKVEDALDGMNASLTDLTSLVEEDNQTKSIEVFDNAVGETGVNTGDIVGMETKDSDVLRPVTLTVEFDAGVDGKTWGDGIYTRCVIGTQCGHLTSPTIHGREVYVKTSGHVAADPSHHWHYAYIFLKQTGSQTWPIQYVVPSSQWMAHRYFDSENPWGDWGDLVGTADYD